MKYHAQGAFSKQFNAIGMRLVPAYLFQGSKCNVLFDAGVSFAGPLYYHALNQIFGNSQSLDYLFITHSHWDHCGALSYLKRYIPNMKIGGHHTVSGLFQKDSVIRTIRLYNDMIQDDQHSAYRRHVRFDGAGVDLPFKDGEIINLGDARCLVYETPGHTRDSVSYFIPEAEILISGEALGVPLGKDGEGVQVEFLNSYDDYLSSIQKLAALKPKILCMAHEWVFTDDDVMRYFEKSYSETIVYRKLIERYLDETNGDVAQAIEVMTRKEYDETGTIYQTRFAYVLNLTAQIAHVADKKV